MTPQDFEATWYPRIGKDAAEELRHYRRLVVTYGLAAPAFAIAAGILIDSGHDLLGWAAAAVVAGYFVMFVRYQVRIAKALSIWFGVRIRGLPLMNPKSFDGAARRYGWRTPEQRQAEAEGRSDELVSRSRHPEQG